MFDSGRSHIVALVPVVLGALLSTAPVAHAQPDDLDGYTPVETADYQVPGPQYGGTVFFTTPDGRHCAIYWNNGPAGCDAVSIDAPEGTNQIRTAIDEPAHFLTSETPTFTHPEAKLLPEGHRLSLENTTCGVGFQGTVSCAVADHGFTLAATYSVLR
ncbi:hypothetical protein [Nocardia paucivorans]|uniref:hypothetical protein n=1 Tax=Nocardia paucivorans TaxID=114259 RepID=UPI00030840D0|nr:hypothetical protein [Nocardia paucivorans]